MNPYTAHFVKETRQVYLWTLHELVHLKRPVRIILDRTIHGSCKLLEGGQLNKGEGGEGKQRGKKGEVGIEGKEREMKQES